ncbi:MAG: hypothetical protein R6W81_12505 [Bacteroidales bacterium]
MKTSIKLALFVVFFLALAGILVGLYLYNLEDKDLDKVTADFTITASGLLKAFEEDEGAASARFTGKIIEVTGVIGSVKPVENNRLNITLRTESDLSSVICTFRSAEGLPQMKAGETVTLRGECSGYLMDVLLNNCVFVR